jgi:hypothetical protein
MAQLPSVRERGESLLSREFMVADDGAWRMEANARTWIWTSTDERAFHFVELSSGIPFMRYHTHARAINLRWVERVEGGLKLGEVMREGHREGVKARRKSAGAPPPVQQQRPHSSRDTSRRRQQRRRSSRSQEEASLPRQPTLAWRTMAWRTMRRRRRHPSSACRPRTR